MQRWKEEFVGNAHKKCVQINRNGVFDQGKVLYMEPDWDCLDLLNAASQRLELVPAAERIFNADGTEIDDCMMIVDDDILFFSKDEDFIQPESTHPENADQAGRSEGERLPNSVGGYKVGELLGRGGFGEVRLGEHQLTGERVALKFLRKGEIQSLGAAERTNTEIQCLATLKHMNIIRLMQHLETSNHVILVFELMEGGDLLKFLLRRGGLLTTPAFAAKVINAPVPAAIVSNQNSDDATAQTGGERAPSKCTLTEDEARHVFYQVVSSISYAHNQHICHRDLKLENILLKDTTLSLVKIADFGLSDFYRPGATMKSSCGTLSFLAPEVFKGTSNAGPPLDVWSLGVILFAMLCGRLPFEGPDLVGTKRPREQIIKSRIMKCQYKIDEHLGPEAKDLVKRMLQVDPTERASIPEIFNHVWMRSAVSGSLAEAFHIQNISASAVTRSTSDTTMLFPPVGSNAGTPNTKETARLLTQSPEPCSTPNNGTKEKEIMFPLERSESMPHTQVNKLGRHRSSQSMNGINLSGVPVGRSNSSISSTKSLMSSTNDLLAMEAQAIAAEQQLHLQGSPPGSAPADLYTSKAAANARLILSPSKDNLSLMEMRQQGSFSSSEFSCLDPSTPCANVSNLSPSPYSIMEEGSTTPSTVTNKAFKLVPQRRQQSNELSGGSEYNSPSGKLRSYSTSDAASVNPLAAANSAIGGSAARPITGRRAGPAFGDYDDDDDSYSTGNWRNITLDPSPSTGNLPASGGTSASRKITGSVSTSSGLNSANSSSKGPRRESLAQSRGSSSTSLGGGTSGASNSNANDQTPTRKSMSSSQASVSRSAASVLSSAAAAVASLALSGSPRDDSAPGGGLFPKPHAGYGHSSFIPSAAASSSGIAAITPVAHDAKRNV